MRNVIGARLDSKARELWEIDKYLWFSLAFAFVYIFVAQARGQLLVPVGVCWLLLALGVINAALRSYVRLISRNSAARRFPTKLFTTADVLLITVAIAVTGGVRSEVWLLFFVAMLSESLYAGPKQTVVVSSAIASAYIAATLPGQFAPHRVSWTEYGTTVVIRLFFLVVIGTYGRIISYTAAENGRELILLHEQVASSDERARIAREIHDSLGHSLVSIILRLELCARLLWRAPDEADEILQEEIPALRSAWNQGRDLAFHLRPWETEVTSPGGLPETLRRLILRFAERTNLRIDFDSKGAAIDLRPAAAYGVTRIVQEALTNAAKHARPSRIDVLLVFTEDRHLECTVTDDGAGFSLASAVNGFGLQAMHERVQALQGQLELTTAPGKGTCLRVRIPA